MAQVLNGRGLDSLISHSEILTSIQTKKNVTERKQHLGGLPVMLASKGLMISLRDNKTLCCGYMLVYNHLKYKEVSCLSVDSRSCHSPLDICCIIDFYSLFLKSNTLLFQPRKHFKLHPKMTTRCTCGAPEENLECSFIWFL